MKTLAEYRNERSLSQAELSIALHNNGVIVGPASIAMYETGRRTPTLEKAQSIARFFGVGTDDIFFGPRAHLERADDGGTTPTGTYEHIPRDRPG